ncbi:MAG: ATP synthase F1 subunit gamma [Chloroflexi bacterium]|nr:ATP synthase F1 subunit gamma [Chloroflexota bacterium]
MPSAKEMRLRIRSVKNISQVTKALETVSASKVRKAVAAEIATRSYAEKAWKVLLHLARQPGHASLHPLLKERSSINNALVLMVSSDRGLAGAYNVNIVRFTLANFGHLQVPVRYITVGRKGRDMLLRRGKNILAEFSDLPPAPTFANISAIGRLVVDEYLAGEADQVYLAYTDFINMVSQVPKQKKLLPLEVESGEGLIRDLGGPEGSDHGVFTYEPDPTEILDQIITRFTSVQIYQAILSSLASEHAARMVAMRNATENAYDLVGLLQLEYNKARQQTITNDMIDIVGGANAQIQS